MMKNRIKRELDKRNKTGYWLALESGLGITRVYNYVNNRSQPNTEALIKISKVLNVAPQDLMYEPNEQL